MERRTFRGDVLVSVTAAIVVGAALTQPWSAPAPSSASRHARAAARLEDPLARPLLGEEPCSERIPYENELD
jgi:hypothetical protein